VCRLLLARRAIKVIWVALTCCYSTMNTLRATTSNGPALTIGTTWNVPFNPGCTRHEYEQTPPHPNSNLPL